MCLENYYCARAHDHGMNLDYAALSDKLTSILALKGSPVAVKLIRTESGTPEGLNRTNEVLRHCEMVQKARGGSKFYATVEQHACKGGAGMLGMIEIPENIKSGEFYYKLGRFSSVEHAAETMQAVPGVDFKTYATAYAPLGETPFEPDVVVLVVNPRQAMMIAQANVYELHSRNTADFSGIQSLCGDAVAAPLIRDSINFTLGCSGSRKYAKVSEDELIVGIPMTILPKLADALQKLA
jgi:uncharacterized protein (DUF169 family)